MREYAEDGSSCNKPKTGSFSDYYDSPVEMFLNKRLNVWPLAAYPATNDEAVIIASDRVSCGGRPEHGPA